MKKVILGAILLVSLNSVALAGYTNKGKEVFYNGKKIGYIYKGWNKWKVYCTYGTYSGKSRGTQDHLYSGQSKEAIQLVVNNCKTR